MIHWLPAILSVAGLAGLAGLLAPAITWRQRTGAGLVLLACCAGLVLVRRQAGQDPTEVQQLLNGLFLGGIYGLIALGYTMVYGVLKLINFAHGEVFMIGAFVTWFVLSIYRHSPPPLAITVTLIAAMAICAAVGYLIERAAYRPLRTAPRLAALITAIGISLLLQNLGMLIFGAQPKTVPSVMDDAAISAAIARSTGLLVTVPNLVTVIAALLLMVGLHLFVTYSRPGRAMRAVSEDREAAQLMGINVDRIISLTFLIGSALAGAGGVLWGIRYPSIKADIGLIPGLKAFVAAVLGGIGSIPGAMIGGLLIGLIEALVSAVTLSAQSLAHLLLALLLMFCFWRLSERPLESVPHHGRGRVLRIGGGLAVAILCWLVAWPAAIGLTPWLSRTPTVANLSGSTFRDAVVFLILIVILIVKPTGIMGRYAPEKV